MYRHHPRAVKCATKVTTRIRSVDLPRDPFHRGLLLHRALLFHQELRVSPVISAYVRAAASTSRFAPSAGFTLGKKLVT